jgi:hypothetical protein
LLLHFPIFHFPIEEEYLVWVNRVAVGRFL